MSEDRDLMKALLRETLQEVLDGEMTEFLGAAAGERTDSGTGTGYRAGYYSLTRVVRIFPNAESSLRLVRALCAQTHEARLEDNRYLNLSLLTAQKKELLEMAA